MGKPGIMTTIVSLALCAAMALTAQGAVPKSLLPAQAQSMALANSSAYKKKYNEIVLKKVKYQEAVKSVSEKKRNMATFRWTPLLSFKFPEKPNLSEEMEFTFKPLQIQSAITTLQHELDDLKFQIAKDVSDVYMDAYVCQEKIVFKQEILAAAQEELTRNQYQMTMGNAVQNDVDVMAKLIETTENELAQLKRTYENDKSRLSDLIGLDVTTGYRMRNSMQTAEISRDDLGHMIQYTLERDQAYYEGRVTAAAALANVNTAGRLMKGQYGSKMNEVDSYIALIRQGKDVDTAAFQLAYGRMLTAVDKPWQGAIRILFIKIPKEWFKGQISGIRYVEDEPYLLYTACLEYISARQDMLDTEKNIRTQVSNSFETIVTAKNAYEILRKSADELKADLDRLVLLNRQGRAEYQEVKDKQSDYQQTQMDMLSALKDYNDLLTAFDRLTCGAITALLTGESLSIEGGSTGDTAGLSVDEGAAPYYYIESRIQDMKFVFGVHIPEDFQPAVTDFELWYGDLMIGERTNTAKQLSHLTLASKTQDSIVTVRFYHEGTYVDECTVDTSVLRGALYFQKAVQEEAPAELAVGTYRIANQTQLGLTTISFTFTEPEIGYYTIADSSGKNLYTDELIRTDKEFTYLSILSNDIEHIRVRLYDRNQNKLYEGWLEPNQRKVMIVPQP